MAPAAINPDASAAATDHDAGAEVAIPLQLRDHVEPWQQDRRGHPNRQGQQQHAQRSVHGGRQQVVKEGRLGARERRPQHGCHTHVVAPGREGDRGVVILEEGDVDLHAQRAFDGELGQHDDDQRDPQQRGSSSARDERGHGNRRSTSLNVGPARAEQRAQARDDRVDIERAVRPAGQQIHRGVAMFGPRVHGEVRLGEQAQSRHARGREAMHHLREQLCPRRLGARADERADDLGIVEARPIAVTRAPR